MLLKNKLNVQKVSNTLEEMKGNRKVKWKQKIKIRRWLEGYRYTYMF